MGILRAIITIILAVFKIFIVLMKVLIRFRLIVLLLIIGLSLVVNFSLFTGKLYFESANSIFANITRNNPITYELRDEIETIRQQLISSEETLNKELVLSRDLKKEIEVLSEKISYDSETIKKKNSENELLKGLLLQNEKLNEALQQKNDELSDSRLSRIIKDRETQIQALENNIAELTDSLAATKNKNLSLEDRTENLSQNLLIKDSRILDLKDRLENLIKKVQLIENEKARLEGDLERRKVKGY